MGLSANSPLGKARAANQLPSFEQQYPKHYAWIMSNDGNFAKAMRQRLETEGWLTDNMLAAVQRIMEAPPLPKREVVAIEATALMAAFEAAKGSLARPKIRFGKLLVYPAPAFSSNAGWLYMKFEGLYVGKLNAAELRLDPYANLSRETLALIHELAKDPIGRMAAYGRETGNCCICGLVLTNPESIERGIGPICAGKFGG